jgi:hypothetical protein
LNIRSLAEVIAQTGTGIEPRQPRNHFTSEDWGRIREAQERIASGRDWAGTILAVLDEVERLRGHRSSGTRDDE